MLHLNELIIPDLQKSNNDKINDLKNALIPLAGETFKPQNRLEFIIGAGVTVSIGFPTWVRLVAQTVGRRLHLFNTSYDSDDAYGKETTKTLHKAISDSSTANQKLKNGIKEGYSSAFAGSDMLEIAEYVLNSVRNHVHGVCGAERDKLANYKITELVYECLHMNNEEFEDKLKEKYADSTMKAVVDVIKKSYGKFNYQEILTYNYDNCLELCLEKKADIPAEKIKSVSYADSNPVFESNKINVAHIHGKINILDRSDISDNIILTESSYRDMEKTEYLWQNTIQVNAMLNSPCLFVGFSAQDYNFRRIIKNSKNINKTYIIFTIDDIIDSVCKNALKEFALQEITAYINEKKHDVTYDITSDKLDMDNVIKNNKDKFLEKIFKPVFDDGKKNDNYNNFAYERLFITYIVKSQSDYWERNNIKPIWTTKQEVADIINYIGSAYD